MERFIPGHWRGHGAYFGEDFGNDTGDWTFDFVPSANMMLAWFANISRLCLAVLFIVGAILAPARDALLGIWARVIESEKPVFSLMFGGVAAGAKFVEACAKYFG